MIESPSAAVFFIAINHSFITSYFCFKAPISHKVSQVEPLKKFPK